MSYITELAVARQNLKGFYSCRSCSLDVVLFDAALCELVELQKGVSCGKRWTPLLTLTCPRCASVYLFDASKLGLEVGIHGELRVTE